MHSCQFVQFVVKKILLALSKNLKMSWFVSWYVGVSKPMKSMFCEKLRKKCRGSNKGEDSDESIPVTAVE